MDKEKLCNRLSIPPRDRYTKFMVQVHSIEQHSTKLDQPRLVTAMQLKYRVLLRVARKKTVGVVLRKYGVRVK
jgi:hypothetical protein